MSILNFPHGAVAGSKDRHITVLRRGGPFLLASSPRGAAGILLHPPAIPPLDELLPALTRAALRPPLPLVLGIDGLTPPCAAPPRGMGNMTLSGGNTSYFCNRCCQHNVLCVVAAPEATD